MTVRQWLKKNKKSLKTGKSVLIVDTGPGLLIGIYTSQTDARLTIKDTKESPTRILLHSIRQIKLVTPAFLSGFLGQVRNCVAVIFDGKLPPLKKASTLAPEDVCEILMMLRSQPCLVLNLCWCSIE